MTIDSDETRYQALLARREHFDGMLWSAPTLSLTAQAFLFTISLGAGTTKTARLIASLLSILVSVLSVQLMARYRAFELNASRDLYALEREAPDGVHRPRGPAELALSPREGPFWMRWLGTQPSARLWAYGLACFGVVSLVVIFLTFLPGRLLR